MLCLIRARAGLQAALAAACLALPPSAAEGADLVIGNLDLALRAFTREELAAFPDNGQADVAELLKKRGFDLPEGGCAYYDVASARIFLRSTEKDLRRLERLAGDQPEASPDAPAQAQVRLEAVCNAVPVSALPADFGPSSSLESLPREKLVLIDRTSLICRSGQRAKTERKPPERQARDEAGAEAAPGPGPGDRTVERTMEIESTVSEDGSVMDINLFWEIDSPLLAPPGERGFFSISNQVVFRRGRVFTQELGLTSEVEPRLVILTLRAEVLPSSAPRNPSPETKPGGKPLTEPAR